MARGLVAVAAAVMAGAVGLGVYGIKDLPRFHRQAPAAVTAPVAASLTPNRSATVVELAGVPVGELRYHRIAVEARGETDEACLVFSAPLDGSGAVRYEDYLALPAGLRAGLRVDGPRLCLSGFAFGSEHRIELRAGLPARGGEKLAEAVAVTVGLGDRPASVAFGPGFVLPRETSDGLPVTTVNTDALEMTVYRVGDRLLARMREDFVDERKVYPYDAKEIGDDKGRVVWSGTMPVKGPRNDAVVSLFPLAEAIGKPEPGAYLVVAKNAAAAKRDEDDDYDSADYRPVAAQWVVHSDLGVTSFNGADGLTVVLRSLKTAKPVEGARLTLIARNNDELAQATSDRDGKVRFAPGLLRGTGGMAPVMVMAYGGGDFNFLDLRRPNFDLSDRGVDGRAPAGPVDAFLYTERGIYRPGETVHLVTMLRDARANALDGRSVVVKVMRPDGREYRRFTVADQGGGAGTLSIALPAAANRGAWEATAHVDPAGEAVGRVAFEVQDFVPQRLGLTIGERPTVLKPGDSLSIPVEARFLYGAPASALGGEGDLSVEPDPAPFPKHKGFRWGLADEKFAGRREELGVAETDAQGRTVVTGLVPGDLKSTLPLRADIGIAIREPGGRATGEHVYVPLRTRPVSLGVRPHFDGSVREGQDAAFDVIAVDEAGERIARAPLDYRVLKDSSTWQWYRSGSNWRYERVARETEVASGTLTVGSDAPAVLRQPVRWGSYRLIVGDRASGASTSVAFWGGWYGNATAERPDRLKVAADKAGYAAGDTARLHVESDHAGEALLVVANEQVHETRNIHIPAGGADIAVAVKPEWGPGAYAMVTLYRPLSEQLGHAPVRAVGLAWLGLDPARRTLSVSIGAPEKSGPRRQLTVPVTVGGGERAFVTLAAVDQGILQLTRFKTPAPQSHYLSKRRLGVGMRDDYGRLIRGLAGQGDDQGGDAFGGKGLDVVPTRTVALFSGIVAVGRDGTASIPLDLPDFQGELRLMAVAYNADKVGSAEARMTVRDPVVAEVILPRFLAPGDQGRATVLLHNVEGGEGGYTVAIRAHDAVAGGAAERTLALAKGRRAVFTVPLDGREAGIGTVQMTVQGPDGFAVDRAWPIQVRPPQLPETRQTVAAMPPGETVSLGNAVLEGFVPGTGAAALSVSRWQGIDVPGLLRWLDRYPFGCLEQTTSRAMPLLYFNDMALLVGGRQDRGIDGRIQDAVERIVSMQTAEGAFRMWGQWGSDADPWLSVFALDFLDRAADKGFDVPAAALTQGRRWLAREVFYGREEVRSYAALVLARKGHANVGDLRYAYDSRTPKRAMGLAHLGAALDAVGERARAASAYQSAAKALKGWAPGKDDPYGSRLRDTYGVAALMAGAGRGAQVPALLAEAGILDTRAEGTTTQEKAWMLLAAAEMARNAGRLAVEIDGKPVEGGDPVARPLDAAALARGVTVRNAGDGEVFRVVSAEGVPAQPLPASGTGMTLTKQVFTLDGRPADLAALRRNDRLVVVVKGHVADKVRGDYAVLDLLPSGWDIEGVLRPEQPGYAWIGTLSEAEMRQARDDRFVAAVAMPNWEMDRSDADAPTRRRNSETWDFTVAYTVRAVTPGSFALPAAVAEHMYVPRMRARTEMGRLVIGE
ncbi:MAG: alpha-2-macroglobulin family protein [Magnetospirillum sp.]|nr:alpha-2-macroglobulin family protein [Magnetospirillum sp.]